VALRSVDAAKHGEPGTPPARRRSIDSRKKSKPNWQLRIDDRGHILSAACSCWLC
jgi:hypothetical protein